MKNIYVLLKIIALFHIVAAASTNEAFFRTYRCHDRRCHRNFRPSKNVPNRVFPSSMKNFEHSTMAACRLSCDSYAGIWPLPVGRVVLSQKYAKIDPSQFVFRTSSSVSQEAQDFINEMTAIFLSNLEKSFDNNSTEELYGNSRNNYINVIFNINSSDLTLNWLTEESYSLQLLLEDEGEGGGLVEISARTVYGARHALETLLQLTAPIIKEGGHNGLVILTAANITDRPTYAHRGLSLDTARNFIPVKDILRTIDGLSSCKMNIFHWHATDSQSFPLEIKRVPYMAAFGAYSPEEIYTTEDIKSIISYAKARGVRVIIELDIPSHSGAGWEWGEEAGFGKLAVCVGAQPWRKSCIQPPCGQLNPVNPYVYDILRNIYKELIEIWGNHEVFHMGGDEVYIPCWNSTKEITDAMTVKGLKRRTEDFLKVWSEFQKTVLKIVDEERGTASNLNVSAIMWSSYLTNPAVIEQYLDKDRYVIHTWVESGSPIPDELLDLGYRLIISTKNAWYLDHGVWGQTKYHTWRDVYLNQISRKSGVLGGEVAMWAEYIDGGALDSRVWPRTAAAAERLWSDPIYRSTASVEPRFYSHRNRLIQRGIRPEAVTPEWCAQNDGECQ
ncbi:chitooligosaccharidolytic beta-N-acetylglucosaminidase [Athalia rosae]|uniref:chitooligosaccharidolytic beta-N-acetylglucosaminidase n=1 Tax=Athalia rosae TaxID=37344 RepID=UPI00203354C7|nr:chitooligosaccharidolytic beta-N-acetylglucosaminidase [Athalia rosae]XP_025602990.2 chitooligosaccharidolytic beta-N-acetylglucosaminidase [Athalia rosae]XP_048514804.1 chitooligosaccharidolytic beta-N-acetylglucosaminidase [Athalia rosae]XP_048514805.1 chitooligosaccharidolytic beta-N-acetylglucosaminidase [Athalia rosae]XP_048514806.1 chitooligosaccharidolytic beta-N-acetylglucosaminidase [Athalia rosae]XP_048514807.1 chitooligosaccharidolytic beta-N-acetylglucosaminidase [Athalia rosae]